MTTADEKMSELPPIERDEHMDRSYIPLPAGYEIQTKGKGSTFRIAKVDGERYPIPLPEFVHEFLTQMALDIREAWQASGAQYSARIKELEQQNEQLQAQVAGLAASLNEAADDIEAWGSYADEYFQKKWGLEEDIRKYKTIASFTTQTAEAYKRRVQAEALENFASILPSILGVSYSELVLFKKVLREKAAELKEENKQ